jgi:hypothetical protein
MKIVVLGKTEKVTNAIEYIANDTYYYVSEVDEAIDAVEYNRAEMLVIENESSIEHPINEIISELNRMPQEVRIILLSSSRHYFIVASNTMNSSIHYYIDEKNSSKQK